MTITPEPGNGSRWLMRRLDEVAAEVTKVRERVHDLANNVSPLLEHDLQNDRRITRLEAKTENLNVTEREVNELTKAVDKLATRFDDVIKALYVGLIGFGASCAAAGLFVFLAFR